MWLRGMGLDKCRYFGTCPNQSPSATCRQSTIALRWFSEFSEFSTVFQQTRSNVPTGTLCTYNHQIVPTFPPEHQANFTEASLGTGYGVLVRNSLISNKQPAIDDLKRLAQLLLVDAQRRVGEESVPAHERVQPLLAEEAAKRSHLLRRTVERSHRLPRLAVANQFDDAEQSNRAHGAHRRMLGLQLRTELFQHRAHLLRVVDQTIFFIHANRSQRRGASHGMTVVGKPSVENFVLKMLRNVMPHSDRAQRKIAGRQSLGHAKQIGHHLPVIDGKPRTSPSKARHHFISDHQDAMLVADLAQPLKISIRRNQNTVGSRHRLENERGDGLRTLKLNGLFDHGERRLSRFPTALDAVIRVEHVNHARNARLRSPSAGIARETHRARSRAVIGTIASDDLVATGKKARELDGVLVGLGAAVGEEEGVDVTRSNFCKLRSKPGARFRSHERISIRERRSLLADGLDDALVAMSDVDGHELAVEVDEAFAFRRVKVDPLGASHRNGIDLRLRGPFVQRVLAREIDDFFASHGRRFGGRGHINPSCCEKKTLNTGDTEDHRVKLAPT